MMTQEAITTSCFLCGKSDYRLIQQVEQKPVGETDYGISPHRYYREICQCNHCGVYFNRRADLFAADFYQGQYNDAIQSGSLERRFSKITKLPFSNSDNKNRVLRIVNYLYSNDYVPAQMKVLDVGSGTCVFLFEMNKFGFDTYCIDPDPVAIKHALDRAGVAGAEAGAFETYETEQKFDLITFNKVLEHVETPVVSLLKAKTMLASNGLVYVELPDGEPTPEGPAMIDRSEFYIDHHTTFNSRSFQFLASSAGLTVHDLSQITDPSGKHTIYGFLR